MNSNSHKGLGEAPEIDLPPFVVSVWEDDSDMVNLRRHITKDMRKYWNMGIEAFIAGDWATAKEDLLKVFTLSNTKDGPTKLLLKKINDHNGKPPPNWQGYRRLY